MKKTIHTTLALATICCMILLTIGCGDTCGPTCTDHDHGSASTGAVACDGDHNPKYNEILVEFPGHQYAMEIIDEKETTGLVTAFLTDAHFEPVAVDTQEVRLNFIVDGSPKVFMLGRVEQPDGEPATFTLTSMELATLCCEGWQGDATASVEINGVPYNAKLVKLADCDHDH